MATVLERPPTKPEPAEESVSNAKIIAVHALDTSSNERSSQLGALDDRIAAALLAFGEYGALAHGMVWAALLSLIPHRGTHMEQLRGRTTITSHI
jgi:hypothetical protein